MDGDGHGSGGTGLDLDDDLVLDEGGAGWMRGVGGGRRAAALGSRSGFGTAPRRGLADGDPGAQVRELRHSSSLQS